jgi:hypothetical protein
MAESEPFVMLPVDVVLFELDVFVDNLIVEFSVGDEVVFFVDRIL